MKWIRPAICFFLISAMSACGARPTLHLNRDGSGRFDLSLQLEKPFVDYLLDLGEVAGMYESRKDAVIFDTATIKRKLEQYPGVAVTGLKTSSRGNLSFSLSFKDVSVFTKPGKLWPKGSPLFYHGGQNKTIRLTLDKTVMNTILTTFFSFEATALEPFLPRQGESLDEYKENLDFALDGGATLFKKSQIDFQIKVVDSIVKHNGRRVNKNTVAFTVPLEKVLFLEKPVTYFIEYQ